MAAGDAENERERCRRGCPLHARSIMPLRAMGWGARMHHARSLGPVMTHPTPASGQSARDRAIAALERAVGQAERGASDQLVTLVSPEDLAALGAADVRPYLDRVMLGEHADLGLDV